MDQKFKDEQKVKIIADADFKYNNRRGGESGKVNDVYYSERYGEYVYEIDFYSQGEARGGYDLIRECDLEPA